MSFFEEVEMAQSQEWEYRVLSGDGAGVEIDNGKSAVLPKLMWHQYLDFLGKDGWEAVGIAASGASGFLVILKRPL